jgi:hypothetical protein
MFVPTPASVPRNAKIAGAIISVGGFAHTVRRVPLAYRAA